MAASLKYGEIIQVLTVLASRRHQCVYMALRLYTEIQIYRVTTHVRIVSVFAFYQVELNSEDAKHIK